MLNRSFALSAALLLLAGCPEDKPTFGVEDCRNGVDDDGDGAVDCDDRECASSCVEICDNGVDDDGNGLADCADEGCFSPSCTEVCGDGLDNDLDSRIDCADNDCAGQCPEACDDSIDNDGDGSADCADSDCLSFCDADGDGFFSREVGYDDCDDSNAEVNPAANEICNKIDDDCDTLIDDEDEDLRGDSTWYQDSDGDGYGRGNDGVVTCTPPPGSANNNTDCRDDNPDINPGMPEVCNEQDDNCDDLVDEDDPSLDPATLRSFHVDADGDGYGDPEDPGVIACSPPAPGLATNADDCDDLVPQVNPGANERECDGLDNDCDPATIDDDGLDSDGDGYTFCEGDCNDAEATANPDGIEVECTGIDEDCRPQTADAPDVDADGFSICDGDCDDTRANVNPGNAEVLCNGRDDDCDPVGTPDDPGVDLDGDTYTVCLGDCDDTNAEVNPGGTEVTCTGSDEDCDPSTPDTPDSDGDGVGLCQGDCDDDEARETPGRPELLCDGFDNDCDPYTVDDDDADADTFSICDGDCDDIDPAVNPGAVEVQCNGIDEDCDPVSFDDKDEDLDGVSFCANDCDDTDPARTPGNDERICDGVDNDCDPYTDDDPGDADGDGYLACVDDCDDSLDTVNPGELELECNFIDDDCNPLTLDEVDADGDGISCYDDCDDTDETIGAGTWAPDVDGDGFADSQGALVVACVSPGPDYREPNVLDDCDDGNAGVNPEAEEICSDGVDQNCDRDDYAPCDTAADVFIIGNANVSIAQNTFTGTESILVAGRNSGHVFCEWTYQTIDWNSDPNAVGPQPYDPALCDDAGGNPCTFAFSITRTQGEEVDGNCDNFLGFTAESTPAGEGYFNNYPGLGPAVMYYIPFAPYYEWFPINTQSVSVDQATGDFRFVAPAGTLGAPY